jgi:hypothetical protein
VRRVGYDEHAGGSGFHRILTISVSTPLAPPRRQVLPEDEGGRRRAARDLLRFSL